jgi:hypothetical protein
LDEVNAADERFNTPQEQAALLLMHLTVTSENRASDDALIPKIGSVIAQTKSEALQTMFRDLFVSLYTSKYKHLTIQEVRAMINTAEIFDDIHESLAVQQYGEEVAAKTRLENAISMLNAGILIEQVASILNLPIEAIEEARKNMP